MGDVTPLCQGDLVDGRRCPYPGGIGIVMDAIGNGLDGPVHRVQWFKATGEMGVWTPEDGHGIDTVIALFLTLVGA